MKKSNLIAISFFLLAVPATLILGSKMPGRWYYLTSTLIIIELLIPFFLKFEGRKPRPGNWWSSPSCAPWQWLPG